MPEFKSTFVVPPNLAQERAQAKKLKKEKLAQKRIDDIKRYKRSLNRIWMAKYIETTKGIPFMEICEGLESKKSQFVKLVKAAKQELVDAKFGIEETEEEEEGEEEE